MPRKFEYKVNKGTNRLIKDRKLKAYVSNVIDLAMLQFGNY